MGKISDKDMGLFLFLKSTCDTRGPHQGPHLSLSVCGYVIPGGHSQSLSELHKSNRKGQPAHHIENLTNGALDGEGRGGGDPNVACQF